MPLEFDLSGLRVKIRGGPPGIARALVQRWSRFDGSAEGEPFLDVEVGVAGAPLTSAAAMDKGMRSTLGLTSARFEIEEGAVEVRADGTASASLAPGPEERQYWGLVNLLCAAAAWRLPSRRGCVLHAACAVLDGRAFVLVGPEGAGKTTWATLAARAGASVLSDDVVLLDGASGRPEALSAPFRDDALAPVGPGRWRVSAILLPRHGLEPRLERVTRLAAEARLAANLLYVAPLLESDPRVGDTMEALASAVPVWSLTFARDARFVQEIRRLAAEEKAPTRRQELHETRRDASAAHEGGGEEARKPYEGPRIVPEEPG